MSKESIKLDNKKAMKKFILITGLGMFCGGVLGFLSSTVQLQTTVNKLQSFIDIIMKFVADWGMMLVFLAIMIPSIYLYIKATKAYQRLDDEDEETLDQIENHLSYIILLLNIMYILLLFIISCSMTYGAKQSILMSIIQFIVYLIVLVYMQQKVIDFTKLLNPEKKGSVYDIDFRKKWINSCDEAERFHIGNASYQAFVVTNMACLVIWIVLFFLQNILAIGILPSFVVLLILGILNCTYIITSIKDNKK